MVADLCPCLLFLLAEHTFQDQQVGIFAVFFDGGNRTGVGAIENADTLPGSAQNIGGGEALHGFSLLESAPQLLGNALGFGSLRVEFAGTA